MLVEVAGAVFEVEDGARLVVGELFEEDRGFVILVEDAGGEVAGEPGVEAGERRGYSGAEARGAGGIGLGEEIEAGAEAGCILVRDGEDADAALRAAGTADEVMAAAGCCVCECGIYDLDEGCHLGVK
jgi:hypothetical protein